LAGSYHTAKPAEALPDVRRPVGRHHPADSSTGAVALIFNGLTSRNGTVILLGLGIFLGCLLVQKLADRYQESAREWVLGLHWGRLG